MKKLFIVIGILLVSGIATVIWHDSYYEDGHDAKLVAEDALIDTNHGMWLTGFGLNVTHEEPYVDKDDGYQAIVVIPYQDDRYGPMQDMTVTLTKNEQTGKWQTESYKDLLGGYHEMKWQWKKD